MEVELRELYKDRNRCTSSLRIRILTVTLHAHGVPRSSRRAHCAQCISRTRAQTPLEPLEVIKQTSAAAVQNH